MRPAPHVIERSARLSRPGARVGSGMTPIEQQTILITGATDGHGEGLAVELVRRGATVLVHGRDAARIERTLGELREVAPRATVRGYRADFSSLAEVRALADEVLAHRSEEHTSELQ